MQYGGPHLCANGKFQTVDGKAHFKAVALPETSNGSSATRPGAASSNGVSEFVVSTRRGKQFNSLVYSPVDPLNGAPRDAVLMNADDAADLHLLHNDRVWLVNDLGKLQCRVFLAPIARGNLQVHWPEGNVIVRHGITDPAGGVPDYNARVTVEKRPDQDLRREC